MTKVDELLIEGKVKEAIEIMCDLPEYEKEREQYIDLFENEHYRQYEVDGILNEILLAYQQYFRDVFYCNSDEEIAADKLIRKLCQTFSISEKEKDALEDRLQELFEQKGFSYVSLAGDYLERFNRAKLLIKEKLGLDTRW